MLANSGESKVKIIAEAGVNHNGDFNLAIALIDKAKEAGANAVKFQNFKASEIVTKTAPKADYQMRVTDKKESQYEMLKSLELDDEEFAGLLDYCRTKEIDFLSTPYSFGDVDFLESIGVEGFKIASGQLTELPFLEYVARKGKPMILSTGMADLAEVFAAVKLCRQNSVPDLVVLQCTTNYPTDIEDANVLAMNTIKEACKVDVGYSDHVANNYAAFASAALGAKVIEKHLTLDNNMKGPDHSSSLEPHEFKNLVDGIRQIEFSLGTGDKIPSQAEVKNTYGMKRGLVFAIDIQENTEIRPSHIGFKRPMEGLPINMMPDVIGKKTTRGHKRDDRIDYSSIQW